MNGGGHDLSVIIEDAVLLFLSNSRDVRKPVLCQLISWLEIEFGKNIVRQFKDHICYIYQNETQKGQRTITVIDRSNNNHVKMHPTNSNSSVSPSSLTSSNRGMSTSSNSIKGMSTSSNSIKGMSMSSSSIKGGMSTTSSGGSSAGSGRTHAVYLTNIPDNTTRENLYGAIRAQVGKFKSTSASRWRKKGVYYLEVKKENTVQAMLSRPIQIFGAQITVSKDAPDESYGKNIFSVYFAEIPPSCNVKKLMGMIKKSVGCFTALNKVSIHEGMAKVDFNNIDQQRNLLDFGLCGGLRTIRLSPTSFRKNGYNGEDADYRQANILQENIKLKNRILQMENDRLADKQMYREMMYQSKMDNMLNNNELWAMMEGLNLSDVDMADLMDGPPDHFRGPDRFRMFDEDTTSGDSSSYYDQYTGRPQQSDCRQPFGPSDRGFQPYARPYPDGNFVMHHPGLNVPLR